MSLSLSDALLSGDLFIQLNEGKGRETWTVLAGRKYRIGRQTDNEWEKSRRGWENVQNGLCLSDCRSFHCVEFDDSRHREIVSLPFCASHNTSNTATHLPEIMEDGVLIELLEEEACLVFRLFCLSRIFCLPYNCINALSLFPLDGYMKDYCSRTVLSLSVHQVFMNGCMCLPFIFVINVMLFCVDRGRKHSFLRVGIHIMWEASVLLPISSFDDEPSSVHLSWMFYESHVYRERKSSVYIVFLSLLCSLLVVNAAGQYLCTLWSCWSELEKRDRPSSRDW